MKVKVTQSFLTLCDPMDYTVHGILQARILDWVAFPFSRGSSQPRDWIQVSYIAGRFFTTEPPEKPSQMKLAQSCLTLCDPMDYTVHGILQARILEWVAISFSRESSQPRDWIQVSHIAGGFFISWATREAQEYWWVAYPFSSGFSWLRNRTGVSCIAGRFYFFFFTSFYFTILYWFCHTLTWIHHGCICLPKHELPSHLPPHNISLGHPNAPAPSMLYPASDIDWRFVSHMIVYMFQCHSPKSSHPLPLPQSPKVCSIHLCLFEIF